MAPETPTIDLNATFLTLGPDSIANFDPSLGGPKEFNLREVLNAAPKSLDDEDEPEDEDEEDDEDEDEEDDEDDDEEELEDEDDDEENDEDEDEEEDDDDDEDEEDDDNLLVTKKR
jgi:hypothetical protein